MYLVSKYGNKTQHYMIVMSHKCVWIIISISVLCRSIIGTRVFWDIGKSNKFQTSC